MSYEGWDAARKGEPWRGDNGGPKIIFYNWFEDGEISHVVVKA